MGTIHANSRDPDQFTVQTAQDVSPIIQHCKDRREDLAGYRDGLVPVAEIPLFIAEQMMQDGSFYDDDAIRRWLNDPDNRCFRVWEGRV